MYIYLFVAIIKLSITKMFLDRCVLKITNIWIYTNYIIYKLFVFFLYTQNIYYFVIVYILVKRDIISVKNDINNNVLQYTLILSKYIENSYRYNEDINMSHVYVYIYMHVCIHTYTIYQLSVHIQQYYKRIQYFTL